MFVVTQKSASVLSGKPRFFDPQCKPVKVPVNH